MMTIRYLLLAGACACAAPAAPFVSPVEAKASGAAADRPIPARPQRAKSAQTASVPPASTVQLLPWTEGAVYRLEAAPEQLSEIMLQPGEILVSVAAGDTGRWVIGDTESGAGDARRVHILLKPVAAGLKTNLVVMTDRRVYRIVAESLSRAAISSIAWTYPEGELVALRRNPAEEPRDFAAAGEGPELERLHFGYRIVGDNPAWRPLRAFDDGRQVFIEFPASLGEGEAPPLFLVGQGGRAELVNYRVRGNWYVVDRLFDAAELRLGERRQQVVRIERDDARPRARARLGRRGR